VTIAEPPRVFGFARRFGVGIKDMIWPPRSLLSDGRVARAGTIEADLWQALDFLYGSCCSMCGIPLPQATTPESVCPVCLASPPQTRFMRAALAYDELSKPLILGMKHGARKDGIAVYANWMVEAVAKSDEIDMVVPIPLHWTRLWSRGYNQAAWLAAAISRQKGLAYAPQCMIRKRRTPTQNGLSFSGRARNVSGAFEVIGDVTGKTILLVDDVFTTGATINACAKALLRAGAAHVDGVALARVVRGSHVDVPDEVPEFTLNTKPALLNDDND
jgi:ComF family protein